jgi:hypothetical protein
MEKRTMPKETDLIKKPVMHNKKTEFYAKVLDEAEKLDFEAAGGIDGIDDEITVIRVKIKYILEHNPENVRLLMEATNMLARLVRTRYNITREQKKGLKNAIGNVLKNYALPLSASIIVKKALE